jgi:hypothetical protein
VPEVEIRGGDEVDALVRRIRTHTDVKALRKELHSGLNRITKPIRQDMKDSTGEPPVLPTSGGLQAQAQARQSVTASIRGGKHAGISIRVKGLKGGIDIGSVHRTGRLRHPVFGSDVWVTQSVGVKPKWMEPVFLGSKPEITRGIQRVLDDIARKVEG